MLYKLLRMNENTKREKLEKQVNENQKRESLLSFLSFCLFD